MVEAFSDDCFNDPNSSTGNIFDTNNASSSSFGSNGVANRKKKPTRPSTPATPDCIENMAKRNALIERTLFALDELPQQITANDDIQVFANYVATRMRKLKKPNIAERKINMVLLQCMDDEDAESTGMPLASLDRAVKSMPQSSMGMIIEDVQLTILGEDNQLFDRSVHKSFRIVDEHGRDINEPIRTEMATLYNLPQQDVANDESRQVKQSFEQATTSSSNV